MFDLTFSHALTEYVCARPQVIEFSWFDYRSVTSSRKTDYAVEVACRAHEQRATPPRGTPYGSRHWCQRSIVRCICARLVDLITKVHSLSDHHRFVAENCKLFQLSWLPSTHFQVQFDKSFRFLLQRRRATLVSMLSFLHCLLPRTRHLAKPISIESRLLVSQILLCRSLWFETVLLVITYNCIPARGF